MVADKTTLEELGKSWTDIKNALEELRQRFSKLPSGRRKSALEATLARLIEHEDSSRMECDKLLRLLQDLQDHGDD